MSPVAAPQEGRRVEGLVLCRVGEHRLAVLASEVAGIDEATAGAPYAGVSFSGRAAAPSGARLLRDPRGGVLVDALEVHSEPLDLLSVPFVLSRLMGGALTGFVTAGEALWPVVSLPGLASFLEGR